MAILPLEHLNPEAVTFPAEPGAYRLRRYLTYRYEPPQSHASGDLLLLTEEQAAQPELVAAAKARMDSGKRRPGSLIIREAEIELRLALTQEAPLEGVPYLAELPLYRGEIVPLAPLEITGEELAKREGLGQAGLGQPGRIYRPDPVWNPPLYLIPVQAVRSWVWSRYGRSIEGLAAFHGITHELPASSSFYFSDAVGESAREAVRQALGLASSGPWFSFDPVRPEEHAELAEYFPLNEFVTLAAVLDLLQSGDVQAELPPVDCALRLALPGEPEEASVHYFEGDTPHALPFKGQPGAIENDLKALFGKRLQLARLFRELNQLATTNIHVVMGSPTPVQPVMRQGPPMEEEKQALYALHLNEAERIAAEINGLYLELTRWAAKQKEGVLQKARELARTRIEVNEAEGSWRERQQHYVQLASNIEGLPPHFAAIPSGLMGEDLHAVEDQFGRAVLKIRRPGLQTQGMPEKEHRVLELDLPAKHEERGALIAQANLVLSPAGPRWLLPQGLVAISKLYRDAGGYAKPETVFRLRLNDWIDSMRPQQVARFKEKGRGEAFGKEHKPQILFDALLGLLNRLTFEAHDGSTVNGFYLIVGHGKDEKGYFAELMLNPKQLDLIAGDSKMFLVTNADAMLNYDRASLDYTPAAQLGLELFARQNLYNRDTATLADPKGGGISRHAYAHKFGLVMGPHDKQHHLLRRFDSVLDNLHESGVIASVERDGHEKKSNPFETKLLITLNPDYQKAYNLTRQLRKQRALEQQLESPFAPPPRLLPRPEPTKPRRGRPKGKKA